jgi:hypothetical protein
MSNPEYLRPPQMYRKDKSSQRGRFLILLVFSLAASAALSVVAAAAGSGLHIGRLGPPSEESRWAQSLLDLIHLYFFILKNMIRNALAISPESLLLLAYFVHVAFYASVFSGAASYFVRYAKHS